MSAIRKIRYTPDEWQIIVHHARACGIPPATYVRITSLGMTPRVARTRVHADVLLQLGRIGNNLNQLARLAHTTGHMPTEGRCRIVLDHLLAAIGRID